MLDQAQKDHFRDKGWLVVNGVFDREEVERIRDIAMEISHAELSADTGGQTADRAEDGQLAPRKINHPFQKSADFREFVQDPRLVALIQELIGAEPLIANDQVFMKPPRFGTAKPYHQDNAYFLCTPADHVITAWIALDDVDQSNGCLRYIDGSHRGEIIPHLPVPGEAYNMAPPPELIDLSKESLAIVREGGVVFHHSQTLHTSHRNESDRWRRGYATHWIAADVTSESTVVRDAYCYNPDLVAA